MRLRCESSSRADLAIVAARFRLLGYATPTCTQPDPDFPARGRAGALALLGACFLLVPSLTIVNSSSGEIVLVTWTDDSGDIHSFGPDLVSDFGQTVPGFMSGGSETMDGGTGSAPLHLALADVLGE
jgi:hypothetical protein